MSQRVAIIAVAALLVVTAAASPARAFVRSVTTDHGTPIFWPSSCVFIEADTDMPTDLSAAELNVVLTRSIGNWQSVTANCSYFKFNIDSPASVEAAPDYKNVVKIRTGSPTDPKCAGNPGGSCFCRPANGKIPEVCYSSSATAITTVYYISAPGKPDDGTIWDADIELNNINFTFVEVPTMMRPRTGTSNADLENTLTHELGHLQGLDHTCYDPTVQSTAPLDNNGKPIPSCDDVQPKCNLTADVCAAVTTSTMFNYARPAEIIKRMPKADDINGICTIYPIAKMPKTCARSAMPGGGCTCSTARARSVPTTPWAALLLPFGAFALLSFARGRRGRGKGTAIASSVDNGP